MRIERNGLYKTLLADKGKVLVKDGIEQLQVVMPLNGNEEEWIEKDFK